jgi:ELWxxDGT repeat protein
MRTSRSFRIAALAVVPSLLLVSGARVASAAGHPGSNPTEIVTLGSRAYFAATTAAHGRELWTTDGTRAGTHELKDINPAASSDPAGLTVAGNKLFFFAFDGAVGGLWVTDGTAPNTMLLSAGEVYNPRNVDGLLFFIRSSTVWTSDGTAAGTDPVEAIPNADLFSTGAGAYQGEYYFAKLNEPFDWRLWSSDGTPAGTHQVAVLGDDRTDVTEFVVSGGLLFFNMLEGGTGGISPGDLWVTNGTAAGTRHVKDLYPDADPKDGIEDADGVGDLTNVLGTLYFSVNNGEIWKTDGTEAGTRRLRVLNDFGNQPMVLARLKQQLMVGGSTPSGDGLDLWRSRGTKSTTVKVHSAGPYSCSESAAPDPQCVHLNYKPVAAGGLLFYASEEGTPGIELWVTNGFAAGTRMVKDIRNGTNSARPSDCAKFGTRVLFVANDGKHGRELWISDGTAPGTKLVKDINPG